MSTTKRRLAPAGRLSALGLAGALVALGCGRDGGGGTDSDRAIQVQRGPQGTEIELNPGIARRNVDRAGRELQQSADQAGRSLERGAREVGEKVGPAARELGRELQQGAHEVQVKAGPAAREAGRQIQQGARKVGAELGPAVRRATAAASVTAAVKAKLIADPEIKAGDVDVGTVDGVVTLSGRVATAAEKAAAERVAAGTDGVKRVVNALQIGPPPG